MHPVVQEHAAGLKPKVSVAVVAICSEAHLSRCLDSLLAQRDATAFEIVVAASPRLGPLTSIGARFPSVVVLDVADRHTPIELAATALGSANGTVILLTEDHCIAEPDWIELLSGAVEKHGRTVGGSITANAGTRGFDWAFYFVDFYRYSPPRQSEPTTSVSVCNVGYNREQLESLDQSWRNAFHETRVHDELRRSAGPHHFAPEARILTGRMVGYRDGHRERYAFGRIFAAGRIDRNDRVRRGLYAAGSAALPFILLARMASRALDRGDSAARFVRSLPHLITLVLAWTLGEFLGYVTATNPRNCDAAAER